MQRSADVREAVLRFCDRLSASDVGSFDELVSQEAALIIGTAPGEWIEDRDRMKFGFEAEGVRLEPDDPRGYEEGPMGWAVDIRPSSSRTVQPSRPALPPSCGRRTDGGSSCMLTSRLACPTKRWSSYRGGGRLKVDA
jgi:hypothetical protein